MIDCIARLLYLKYLYFNAGQTVLSKNYSIFSAQIDYIYAEKEYQNLVENLNVEKKIYLCDKNSVVFNYLIKRLLLENFMEKKLVFCVLSPFYSDKVIDYILIPSEEISVINRYDLDGFSSDKGYISNENSDISDYNFSVANEFFERSKKI